MELWNNIPVSVAVLLALAAAVMSSSPSTRQKITLFSIEALMPNVADMGGDPGYLNGVATESQWLPPPNPNPVIHGAD